MIRFGQRDFDVQGTERVFKKVVHSGQNALRIVDKDGIPMRMPNTTMLSRLHSTYVLSPRGVPTRKSNHSYSGQLAQAKMQNLVNSLETTSQEMTSYNSLHSYGNGLSSAGSSRHYLSTANSHQRKPPRNFGAGGPKSVKSMNNKSASSQRSARVMVSAQAADQLTSDLDKTNESPQGQRLEKEWSALSQCRALKRSSEIVSHRVDRMYFMTGNKLKIESKFHVEDNELQHLRDLQQARVSSRSSRSGRSNLGDTYRPDLLSNRSSELTDNLNGDHVDGTVVVSSQSKRAGRHNSVENGFKENKLKEPQVIVSQKVLTPKPHSSRKSPISGWSGEDNPDKDTNHGIEQEVSLHEDRKVHESAENGDAIAKKANTGEVNTKQVNGNENGDRNGKTVEINENGNEIIEANGENVVTEGENNDNGMSMKDTTGDITNTAGGQGNVSDNDNLSVQRDEAYSVITDQDKIDIKSEDYLQ